MLVVSSARLHFVMLSAMGFVFVEFSIERSLPRCTLPHSQGILHTPGLVRAWDRRRFWILLSAMWNTLMHSWLRMCWIWWEVLLSM